MKREYKYHRIYGEGLFQVNFYVFSLAKGLKEEWSIYLRHLKDSQGWYIGKVSDEGVLLYDGAFLGETGLILRSYNHKLRTKVADRWRHQLEPRSVMCYNSQMTRRRKPERDREIVYKIDELKWSMRQCAAHYGMSVSSIHEAYYRELKRCSVTKVRAGKLSPVS